MTAVAVTAGVGSFDAGTPVALFDSHISARGPTSLVWEYDVARDGKRFLVNATSPVATTPPLNVVVNWNAAAK